MRNGLAVAVLIFSLLPNALSRSQISNPKTVQGPPGRFEHLTPRRQILQFQFGWVNSKKN